MARIWEWREDTAAALWEEARGLLQAGRLLALPTETYYALAAHPFRDDALARLFSLKERPQDKPILLLVSGPRMLPRVARDVPAAAEILMERFWPGPLTLILPAAEGMPAGLTGGTGTVGVRQPRQPAVLRLLEALDLPLTGTSANRSGRPPLVRSADVVQEFGDEVPLVLDAGPCPGGLPSTIVDVTRRPPRLVRLGAVPAAALFEVIGEMETE